MNIHLRADSTNTEHTKFTVFIDHKNCGQLCMGTQDAVAFHMLIQTGIHPGLDTFMSSGDWHGDQDEISPPESKGNPGGDQK